MRGKIGLVVLNSAEKIGTRVDQILSEWRGGEHFIIPTECPRFSSGEGKCVMKESVRDRDIYILVDVCNHSLTYEMFGEVNRMSPDDHFMNLLRIIQAIGGKATRITVITPQLYGSRQHRRTSRESLDCACALQILQNMGVRGVVTFDAHDGRVENAIPLMNFDNLMPHYQVLKAMFKRYPDISTNKEKFMVVSPDEGAMNRNMYYSSVLGVNLGMFYKRRDYSRIVNGRNPIVAHEYLGDDVTGKGAMFLSV